MSIFDGDFDLGDAFALGAAIGFAEESMKREEEGEKDVTIDDVDLSGVDLQYTYADLQRLAKSNPKLFRTILLKSVELQVKYEKAMARRVEEAEDHELVALAKTEQLLKE